MLWTPARLLALIFFLFEFGQEGHGTSALLWLVADAPLEGHPKAPPAAPPARRASEQSPPFACVVTDASRADITDTPAHRGDAGNVIRMRPGQWGGSKKCGVRCIVRLYVDIDTGMCAVSVSVHSQHALTTKNDERRRTKKHMRIIYNYM
jgi:hypothetical protein